MVGRGHLKELLLCLEKKRSSTHPPSPPPFFGPFSQPSAYSNTLQGKWTEKYPCGFFFKGHPKVQCITGTYYLKNKPWALLGLCLR